MNRQIKFRVWNGHSMEYRVLAGALGHFYVEGMSKKDSACLSDANTIYNEATPLMQWTGLFDKNDKEIWEGDILQGEEGQKLEVVQFDGAFWAELISAPDKSYVIGETFLLFSFTDKDKTTVIGNIHANPELLK